MTKIKNVVTRNQDAEGTLIEDVLVIGKKRILKTVYSDCIFEPYPDTFTKMEPGYELIEVEPEEFNGATIVKKGHFCDQWFLPFEIYQNNSGEIFLKREDFEGEKTDKSCWYYHKLVHQEGLA